jgi:hypothetical protein
VLHEGYIAIVGSSGPFSRFNGYSEGAMAIAINIRAENPSASEVERLWDEVAAFEDVP